MIALNKLTKNTSVIVQNIENYKKLLTDIGIKNGTVLTIIYVGYLNIAIQIRNSIKISISVKIAEAILVSAI